MGALTGAAAAWWWSVGLGAGRPVGVDPVRSVFIACRRRSWTSCVRPDAGRRRGVWLAVGAVVRARRRDAPRACRPMRATPIVAGLIVSLLAGRCSSGSSRPRSSSSAWSSDWLYSRVHGGLTWIGARRRVRRRRSAGARCGGGIGRRCDRGVPASRASRERRRESTRRRASRSSRGGALAGRRWLVVAGLLLACRTGRVGRLRDPGHAWDLRPAGPRAEHRGRATPACSTSGTSPSSRWAPTPRRCSPGARRDLPGSGRRRSSRPVTSTSALPIVMLIAALIGVLDRRPGAAAPRRLPGDRDPRLRRDRPRDLSARLGAASLGGAQGHARHHRGADRWLRL